MLIENNLCGCETFEITLSSCLVGFSLSPTEKTFKPPSPGKEIHLLPSFESNGPPDSASALTNFTSSGTSQEDITGLNFSPVGQNFFVAFSPWQT